MNVRSIEPCKNKEYYMNKLTINKLTILLLLTLVSLFCYDCNGLSSNREKVSKEPLKDSIKVEIKIKFIDTVLLPDTISYRK